MAFGTASAAAAAALPPGLPGPPPAAGSGFPLPPPPGAAPGSEAGGAPASIPVNVSGPGLLTGTVTLYGNAVTLLIACSTGGNVDLSVPSLGGGALAHARYRCSRRRASIRLSLDTFDARRIARHQQVLAALRFREGGASERLSVTVAARPQAPSYWTSDFGLRCDPSSYRATVLAPNFSDTLSTTIDVRPWLAWYTAATGWRWLGTAGVSASRWYRWTATTTGVAEWQTPTGEVTPWTWSPITVAPGQGVYLVAVFEAIYWYGHPQYVWSYARAGDGPHTLTTYCAYP
ncbi:MAG: hypothetical protein JOY89_05460 [Solirubrobacterales bacterium]|nr:hypothetical protein [Solirubrobacterales bacterium]